MKKLLDIDLGGEAIEVDLLGLLGRGQYHQQLLHEHCEVACNGNVREYLFHTEHLLRSFGRAIL